MGGGGGETFRWPCALGSLPSRKYCAVHMRACVHLGLKKSDQKVVTTDSSMWFWVGGGLVSSIWPRFLLANGCEDPNDWICVQAWNIRK